VVAHNPPLIITGAHCRHGISGRGIALLNMMLVEGHRGVESTIATTATAGIKRRLITDLVL
jgi:hypothetical protein